MVLSKKTEALIEDYVNNNGEENLVKILENRLDQKETLTIVCDRTMHVIPDSQLIGHVHDFSKGNFDTSSSEAMERHLKSCLRSLNNVLRSKEWNRVRVIISSVPSGGVIPDGSAG